MTAVEKKISFKSSGKKLFGILHIPDKKANGAILFANGWPDNCVDIHTATAAARYFTAHGYAFLRFNPRGRWPSGGIFVKQGVFDQAEDTANAIKYLRSKGYSRIGLIGHSLGGLAALTLKGEGLDAAVLWEPSSAKMLYSYFGKGKWHKQLSKNGFAVNEQYGSVWGAKLVEDLKEIRDGARYLKEFKIPIMFVAGTKPASILTESTKRYFRHAIQPKRLRIIDKASHTFDNQGHEKLLHKYTLEWFDRWF